MAICGLGQTAEGYHVTMGNLSQAILLLRDSLIMEYEAFLKIKTAISGLEQTKGYHVTMENPLQAIPFFRDWQIVLSRIFSKIKAAIFGFAPGEAECPD